MACRNAYKTNSRYIGRLPEIKKTPTKNNVTHLVFGVDSGYPSNEILQNNLTLLEWVARNKIYPAFWCRNLTGEGCLTKEEVKFLRRKACKIAPIYCTKAAKDTEERGLHEAQLAVRRALELAVPRGNVIFLEIVAEENATRNYLRGYAKGLIKEGYTPGFKANTDATFPFDREFSRGMQTDRDVFERCLVYAVAPSLTEYQNIRTTHLIHPDNWTPFAPSGMTRRDIAIWQYGRDCHPIESMTEKVITFNLNLIRNDNVMIEKMF